MIKTLYPPFRKWSEKGSVWIISDTHFDDPDRNVMGYEISEEEQTERIRKKAHRCDCLIHLGDVGNPERMREIKAYKVLIMGNHDQSVERFAPYFDEIYSGPLFIADRLLLSHEPTYGQEFYFNVHGHDHSPENKGDEFHLNLAANVCGYDPVNLANLIKRGVLSRIPSIHRITIDEATKKKLERTEKLTNRETEGMNE